MTITPQLGDRSLFPTLEARVYLNHAAVSPISEPVKSAMVKVMDDYATRGVAAVMDWVSQRDGLREEIAGLIGAKGPDIGLVPNTTQGVIDIALCHPWSEDDRILLFEGEFPANVTPWQRAGELFGVGLEWMPIAPFERDHGEGLEGVERRLKAGVSFIAVSAVQFQTGLRMPLEELGALCRAYGACLFVDAIQGCGVCPIDVGVGIDYLSCGGHKWLMGVEGAGFLYVAPHRVSRLRPHVAGWLSHEEGLRFLFEGEGHLRYDRPIRQDTSFVEPGAQNAIGYAGLEASIKILRGLGVGAIYQHVSQYHDRLEEGLRERGFQSLRAPFESGRSGTLSVLAPAGVSGERLLDGLLNAGVACTFPDGKLRFAPHWPNAHHEVSSVLAAVDESLGNLR